MADDPIWEAARLNSLAQDEEHGGSMLEDLWAQCPGFIDTLPFFNSKAKGDAASAYLYAAKGWLSDAKAVYPKVSGNPDGAVQELLGNMARVEKNVSYLEGMGYSDKLDGVSSALADLAKKIRNNTPSPGALGLGVVVGVGLVLFFLFRSR